jgi:Flp pilus assembly protein TadG
MRSEIGESLKTRRNTAGARCQSSRLQSGQALVEFAFVLPILLILALGVIEIGRYAYISILLGNAARAGAAYGAQSNGFAADTTGIQNAAYYDFAGGTSSSNSQNGLSQSTITVTSSFACGCDSGGTITSYTCSGTTTAGSCPVGGGHWVIVLSVTASGTYNSLFSYPGIPKSITVSNTASMRVG